MDYKVNSTKIEFGGAFVSELLIILTYSCISAWYGNRSASDHNALQRVLLTAQYITGAKLPAIQDLYIFFI
jgi:hypothetical protein